MVKAISSNTFSKFETAQKPSVRMQNFTIPEEKEKRNRHLGRNIVISGLAVGFGLFALMKGLPKGAYKKVNDFFKYLDDKIIRLKENKNANQLQTTSIKFLKKIQNLTARSKVIFNFAPLKDVLFKKFTNLTKFTRKCADSITNLFKKIGLNTVKKSYKKTLSKFDNAITHFNDKNAQILSGNIDENIVIGGIKKTRKQWVEVLDKKIAEITKQYNTNFREPSIKARYNLMDKNLEGIDKDVWNSTYAKLPSITKGNGKLKEIIADKNSYTFISEELAAPHKIDLANKMEKLRENITHDINDNCKSVKKLLNNVETFIDPADKPARDLMKNIRKSMTKYSNLSGKNENIIREELVKNVNQNLTKLSENIINSDKYSSAITKEMNSYINQVNKVLVETQKGPVQEILTIYKCLLSPKDYQNIKKHSYKFVKSLDKSVDLESDKFFDKLRDLKIGSAPTDVLSIIGSLGVIGYGLTKADSKDERISVGLKYGVPVVGAVATSLYLTAGLISGGTAMIIGMATGLVLGKVCNSLNKFRLSYKEDLQKINIMDKNLPILKEKNEK